MSIPQAATFLVTSLTSDFIHLTVRKKLNLPQVKPWMRYREVVVIEELLKRCRPQSCLEWGSGYSTLYFPRQLSETATWLAVEHHEKWAGDMQAGNHDPRVTIAHVPTNKPEYLVERGNQTFRDDRNNAAHREFNRWLDGSPEEFGDYIEYPEQRGPFDFVLVDGRARNDCVEKTVELLSDNGVVVVHDANRPLYAESEAHFPHHASFYDARWGHGGLWIGRKGGPVEDILDVDRHHRLWQVYAFAGSHFQ